MIWSEKELAYMPIAGEKVILEKVMPKLHQPENKDIFLPSNFSLLWGILGVVGVEGATAEARLMIWKALCENGALRAFSLGVLADYTQRMNVKDQRLRGWCKLDNYEAGVRFSRLILDNIVTSNNDLCSDVFSFGYQPWSFLDKLNTQDLFFPLKAYLEQIRAQALDNTFENISRNMAYLSFLEKLVQVIAYMSRELIEIDKRYFFFYFQDILSNGFNRHELHLTDHFWARLMLRKDVDELSEIERTAFLTYNQDVIDYVWQFEEEDGFYEECAVLSIYGDAKRSTELTERCLFLAKKQSQPTGVVFAKALINLGQIRSAVLVLQALAKSGQATMMTCYINVLLPLARGAETVLLQILRANLFAARTNASAYMNGVYKEYISKFYLQAVRAFIDNASYRQAAALLQELVLEQWFDDSEELRDSFISLANILLEKDSSLQNDLTSVANRLNIKLFSENGLCYFGYDVDNPLTKKRQAVEENIKNLTDLDITPLTDSFTQAEATLYNGYSQVKNALRKTLENKESRTNDSNDKLQENNVLEINSNDVDKHFEEIKKIADAAICEEKIENNYTVHENMAEPENLQKNEKDNTEILNDENLIEDSVSKNSINLTNLLNLNADEIERHFEQIKNTVGQKAEKFKENIKGNHAMEKIKNFAGKIKFIRKK